MDLHHQQSADGPRNKMKPLKGKNCVFFSFEKTKVHLLFEKLIPSRKFINDFDKNRFEKNDN